MSGGLKSSLMMCWLRNPGSHSVRHPLTTPPAPHWRILGQDSISHLYPQWLWVFLSKFPRGVTGPLFCHPDFLLCGSARGCLEKDLALALHPRQVSIHLAHLLQCVCILKSPLALRSPNLRQTGEQRTRLRQLRLPTVSQQAGGRGACLKTEKQALGVFN